MEKGGKVAISNLGYSIYPYSELSLLFGMTKKKPDFIHSTDYLRCP